MSLAKGKKGEDTAVQYLLNKGISVLARNYKGDRFGEIDIIAKDGEIYVFIEVKSFKQNSLLDPRAAITEAKQEKIKHAAEIYLEKNDLQQVSCRFDVLKLTWANDQVTEISWLKDAFR